MSSKSHALHPYRSSSFMEWLYAWAAPKWALNPTMQAVRNGFLLCLPLVVAGALAVLCNNLPLPVYQEAMLTLFGPDWKSGLFALIWQGSFGLLSLPMVIGISHNLVLVHNQENPLSPVSPVTASVVALGGFLVLLPPENMTGYLGVQGLFVGILASLTAIWLFLRLVAVKALQMQIYSEGIALAPQAFASLIAGLITLFVFAVIGLGFRAAFGLSIQEAVRELVLLPFRFDVFRNMLGSGIAYVLVTHVCWFFGLHGTNVLDPLTRDIFEAATQANLAALAQGLPPPHIITKSFLDIFVFMGGAGTSICLLLAIFIASRNHGSRRMAKISIAPGLFNINEIVLFGLPVILNPVFLLPFLLVPLMLTLVSFLAIRLGFVPLPMEALEWTTPPILGGMLATHSVAGSVLQIFNLVLGTFIYLPFVKISDRIKAERQKVAQQKLLEIACNNTVGPSGKKCLDRDDEVGSLARILAHELELAMEAGEGLYLEYQPQVDGRTSRVIGTEALVRWRHPVFGPIPAPIIIAISEDGEFIRHLGLWVLNEACAERARWHEAGLAANFKTSVNLSARQLDDESLPEKVAQCRNAYHLSTPMIGIEVTESVALDPDAMHNQILNHLHDLGFAISIDDFGMGHSSLVYLKYFPVNVLKIDKVLSKDVATSKISAEVIATIVELCRALKIKVVAEFVENQEQVDCLQTLGCHLFQGYFYSPPLKGDDMLSYAMRMNATADMAELGQNAKTN
ncbi:MAG: EAL domain-containing protein [Candidatus Accumulibacter sp.]|jgi:lactose/cellobiose-specific phosphotransferase system IIC component|nr:EAL domain-containing protein [Accumulibacter sp.]